MVSITLAVPRELKQEMDELKEINWSEIARTAIKNKIVLLKKFKEFTKNSTLTEQDALDFGRKVNKSLHKRLN